jgi:hypothetical protein
MAKIDNRLLLVLVVALVLISVMGTYAVLSNFYVAPVAPPAEGSGIVGVNILNQDDAEPKDAGSGIVGVNIFGGSETD